MHFFKTAENWFGGFFRRIETWIDEKRRDSIQMWCQKLKRRLKRKSRAPWVFYVYLSCRKLSRNEHSLASTKPRPSIFSHLTAEGKSPFLCVMELSSFGSRPREKGQKSCARQVEKLNIKISNLHHDGKSNRGRDTKRSGRRTLRLIFGFFDIFRCCVEKAKRKRP